MLLKFGKMGAAGRKARRTLSTILAATPGSHWWDMRVPTAQSGWRRNLLSWSEDFGNAVWTKTSITPTSGAPDPQGGTSATTLTATGANGTLYESFASIIGAAYAGTLWMRRRSGSGSLFTRTANDANVDVSSLVTSTWSSVPFSATATGTTGYFVVVVGTSGDQIDIWHPQVSLASVDQTYQKITDGYTEFLAAYPTTALYQDAAGTTPVTAVGQYLGLCLDKPAGAVQYGPELVVNGGSPTTEFWTVTLGGTLTSVGSGAKLTTKASTYPRLVQTLSTVPGSYYEVRYETVETTSNLFIMEFDGQNAGNRVLPGMYPGFFKASGSSAVISLSSGYYPENYVVYRNISVREVIGTPLTQSTTTKRPQLLGTPALPKFDGADDALSTGAITLTSNMDCFVVVRRDSAANTICAASVAASAYFGAAIPSGSAPSFTAGLGSPSVRVDGVATGATQGTMHTALSVGALHLVEMHGCNLSGWSSFELGWPAASYPVTGSVPEVVLCPALSDADRTIVRKELASRYGITL